MINRTPQLPMKRAIAFACFKYKACKVADSSQVGLMSDCFMQEKISGPSHNAFAPNGIFVQVVMWGDSDEQASTNPVPDSPGQVNFMSGY